MPKCITAIPLEDCPLNNPILTGPGPIGPGVDGERKDNVRSKPLSGKLQITLKGARELDHAPIVSTFRSRSSSKQVETFVSFRVEGSQHARSHPSKTDRWMETFEITIDKANEVEIAVYDKQASEPHPQLIGLLWVKINDLVEAQRRQKVMIESGQGGWVTAGAMNGDAAAFAGQPASVGDMNAPIPFGDPRVAPMGGSMPGAAQSEGIDAWFAVEPAGALALRLNFSKSPPVWHIRLHTQHHTSQGERPQATARHPRRSRTPRCRAQTEGRGARDERPQVHPTAVLPGHPLCLLQRVPSQRSRVPMRRLSIHMS